MHNKVEAYVSNGYNPYRNLAIERALFDNAKEGVLILYLWQNENTVVIGRHQNAYLDVDLKKLYADGGLIARRLTGGGAVYHDLGNLNFSFVSTAREYDLSEDNAVVLDALKALGFSAEISGRNDLEIDGRKISGNAYYKDNRAALHHGTLMLSVDVSRLSNYLNVNPDKLKGKGVSSVRARVVNLAELNKNIDEKQVKNAILAVLNEKYDEFSLCDVENLDAEKLLEYEKEFSDRGFLFGREVRLQSNRYERFAWGYADVHFVVDKGVISAVEIYSDALDTASVEDAKRALTGASVIKEFACENQIANDVFKLIIS